MANGQKALYDLGKTQLESSLTALDCQERIFALEAVLVALDHRAKEMLEKQLVVERDKHQKQRETLQMMLRLLQTGLPEKPS
jgi:hypothetical protein